MCASTQYINIISTGQKLYQHTLRSCNIYFFYVATFVARTRLNVTSCVHFLSLYNRDSVFTARYELIFKYSLDYTYSQSLNCQQQQHFPYSVRFTDTLCDTFRHTYSYFDDTNPFYFRFASGRSVNCSITMHNSAYLICSLSRCRVK